MTDTTNLPAVQAAGQPAGGLVVRSMDDLARMSKAIAESGMFRDCATPQRAAVKMMFAMAMGFEPVTGLTGIDIIEGNPTPNGHFWAAALESHPRYDYEVVRSTDIECTIAFFRDGRRRGEVTWTMDDAKRAALAGKENWKKYPRAMLYNRAMTEGGRMFCPQLFGGIRAYTPEELGSESIATAPAVEPVEASTVPLQEAPAEPRWRGDPDDDQVIVDADTGEVIDGQLDMEDAA